MAYTRPHADPHRLRPARRRLVVQAQRGEHAAASVAAAVGSARQLCFEYGHEARLSAVADSTSAVADGMPVARG